MNSAMIAVAWQRCVPASAMVGTAVSRTDRSPPLAWKANRPEPPAVVGCLDPAVGSRFNTRRGFSQ